MKQANKINVKRKRRSKMQHKRLKLIVLLLSVIGLTGLQAQESLNATGGKASGNGGTVSYSLGQVVYLTKSGTNGFVDEGVQQPYEISVVTGIKEAKGISLSLTAYPNPTSDNLTLRISDVTLSNLSYQLYDMQGILLQHNKISGHNASIKMSTLVPAIYFVKVFRNDVAIKTFKIIKNK